MFLLHNNSKEVSKNIVKVKGTPDAGGGTWVFFGWVCAAWDSKLVPRSRKNFP